MPNIVLAEVVPGDAKFLYESEARSTVEVSSIPRGVSEDIKFLYGSEARSTVEVSSIPREGELISIGLKKTEELYRVKQVQTRINLDRTRKRSLLEEALPIVFVKPIERRNKK